MGGRPSRRCLDLERIWLKRCLGPELYHSNVEVFVPLELLPLPGLASWAMHLLLSRLLGLGYAPRTFCWLLRIPRIAVALGKYLRSLLLPACSIVGPEVCYGSSSGRCRALRSGLFPVA